MGKQGQPDHVYPRLEQKVVVYFHVSLDNAKKSSRLYAKNIDSIARSLNTSEVKPTPPLPLVWAAPPVMRRRTRGRDIVEQQGEVAARWLGKANVGRGGGC